MQSEKKVFFIRVLLVFTAIALLLFLASCSAPEKTENAEILSQKAADPSRTQLTILVKYAFSINRFEEAVEAKFPDIDIVQVGNYTHSMGTDEYKKRLEHDDLTDIVMTWPMSVGEEYLEDRLLDLSGMAFTSRYNLSTLNEMSQDGSLYYLPGPAQVRGIIYNKTLFQEKGWNVPTDYSSFIALCKTIEDSGMRSIQFGFENEEVLDTAFVGYNYGNFYSKPQDAQWLDSYNAGNGSFGDHFGAALDVFKEMCDAGVWKKSDLDISYSDRERMLTTRECAMVEDSVLMARMASSLLGSEDEFALMPFFNPGIDNEWARLYRVCYIGMNKHLAEPENKEKYELALKLMDYISTPEGQEALGADTGAMFSSLVGVAPPDVPEIQALLPTLNHGRYTTFPELENAQPALRKGLSGLLRGDMTKEDVIKMVDAQNTSPPEAEDETAIGTADSDFTLIETGNFVTDAMRSQSGCDIALFLDNGKDGKYNGKGISARFYSGPVTSADVLRILPDLKHDETGTLWKVSMTGENLIQTLEYAIPVDNNVTGWFYYFSGLRAEYAPSAEPGQRIRKIITDDGRAIDPDQMYTVAVMDETVPAEFFITCEKTGDSIAAVVEQAISGSGAIAPSGDGRFTVIQN
ncbi:extracellular solute-binding protein [Eubacterium sp. 1001713B170207_170306_E7]|uniref:extracellular solute-binding protein n=1 Tax=Eubacterium sp. 1001713B170207_170306_E7 TaxID=2787097 RepID=UPI00325FDE0E